MPRHDISLCGKRFGTSFAANQQWLSLNLCGALGVTVSWSIHLYSLAVTALYLISHSPVALGCYVLLYCPTAGLALVSLFRATFTDPGAVPLGARPLTTVRPAGDGTWTTPNTQPQQPQQQRTLRRCHKCHDNYKPPRAHHDSVTGRCIVKLDHYCPWVNNAIGILNHKYFVLFLLYTALCCVQVLLLLCLRLLSSTHSSYECVEEEQVKKNNNEQQMVADAWLHQQQQQPEETAADLDCHSLFNNNNNNTLLTHPLVLLLTGIALLFLVFTCAMGYEQWEAIQTGHNKIARMQLRVGQRGTELQRIPMQFNELFGTTHWWSPFHAPQFPRGMRPVVLGYEYDATLRDHGVHDPPEAAENGGGSKMTTTTTTTSNRIRQDDDKDVEMQTILRNANSLDDSSSPSSSRSSSRNRRKAPSSRSSSLEIV